MSDITYRVALEVVTHEGIVPEAYKDSVGVWTWSVGITSMSGHNVERYIGTPQSLEHCLRIYVWALERYAADVRKAFNGRRLTEAQFAGALSFHYNTGAIGRASWVRKWLSGDVSGAKRAFMAWRKPPEIIDRRRAERDLFFDGTWSQTGTATVYTRVKAGGRIDWGSARRVDISDDLRRALNPASPQPDVPAPEPKPKPTQPDDPGVSDEPPGKPKRGKAGVALVIGILTAVIAWGATTGFDLGQIASIIDMLRDAQ